MDLFSFLDPSAAPDSQIDGELEDEKAHKRKASQEPYNDAPETFTTAKKPRLAGPNPVVLDAFETEASREVAASAGLTGTADDASKLELRHQVQVCQISLQFANHLLGSSSSSRTPRLQLCSHCKPRSSCETRERIQVQARSIPGSLRLCNTAQRKCLGICTY